MVKILLVCVSINNDFGILIFIKCFIYKCKFNVFVGYEDIFFVGEIFYLFFILNVGVIFDVFFIF